MASDPMEQLVALCKRRGFDYLVIELYETKENDGKR